MNDHFAKALRMVQDEKWEELMPKPDEWNFRKDGRLLRFCWNTLQVFEVL